MSVLTDYVVFHDSRLAARYAASRMPIDTLFEAYFEGALDIPGNIYALLADRHAVVKSNRVRQQPPRRIGPFGPGSCAVPGLP